MNKLHFLPFFLCRSPPSLSHQQSVGSKPWGQLFLSRRRAPTSQIVRLPFPQLIPLFSGDCHFLTALLQYNLHPIKFTHCNRLMTYRYTTVTTTPCSNVLFTPKSSLMFLWSVPGPTPRSRQAATNVFVPCTSVLF